MSTNFQGHGRKTEMIENFSHKFLQIFRQRHCLAWSYQDIFNESFAKSTKYNVAVSFRWRWMRKRILTACRNHHKGGNRHNPYLLIKRNSTKKLLDSSFIPVFPNLFLASAPFSDKQICIAPLPSLAHISTQFFHIVHLACLKMIKTRMSAKMHFTIKLNLVN